MTSRERVATALAYSEPDTPLENVLTLYRTVARRRGHGI